MRPNYFTDRPRKYLVGRRYKTYASVAIFGGSRFAAGTSFSATGQLGSMLSKPGRGKRHPDDLLIEVRKRRPCKQSYVYDFYWIPARLFDDPRFILHIRKVRKKEAIRKNIDRELDNIRRRAQSL